MIAKDYPHDMVIIRCDDCGREGRYRKASFLAIVGPETPLPTALGIIAKDCPKANKPVSIIHDRCRCYYPGLSATKPSN